MANKVGSSFESAEGADVFRKYNPLMELYLYGIGTGTLLPVMVFCYAWAIQLLKEDLGLFCIYLVLLIIPFAILTSLSIFVTVRFISLCVSRYA